MQPAQPHPGRQRQLRAGAEPGMRCDGIVHTHPVRQRDGETLCQCFQVPAGSRRIRTRRIDARLLDQRYLDVGGQPVDTDTDAAELPAEATVKIEKTHVQTPMGLHSYSPLRHHQ